MFVLQCGFPIRGQQVYSCVPAPSKCWSNPPNRMQWVPSIQLLAGPTSLMLWANSQKLEPESCSYISCRKQELTTQLLVWCRWVLTPRRMLREPSLSSSIFCKYLLVPFTFLGGSFHLVLSLLSWACLAFLGDYSGFRLNSELGALPRAARQICIITIQITSFWFHVCVNSWN